MGRPANLAVNILGNNADLLRALQGSDSALGRFGQATSKVMTGVAAAWTGAATVVGAFAVSVFKTGVEYNVLNQKANAAFNTILGSAEAASAMMSEITAFAKTSPFPRQAFIKASQQMLAFGYASEKVIPTLSAIQDAVAAAGGSSQQLEEVAFVLSQIQAAGKITGIDLIQLGQRGINAAELIGSQMGKTGAEIKAMITEGALPAGQALDAIAAGMTERFGGAAAAVKETWIGATDRIKGALRDIGSMMADPFITSTGGGLGVGWANQLADILRGIQPIIGALVTQITTAFGGQFTALSGILDKVAAALKGIDVSGVASQLMSLAPGLAVLTGAFAAMTGGLGAGIPVIGGLLASLSSPIGILVAAMGALVAVSPDLQQMLGGVLQDALKALAPILPILTTAMGQLATLLGRVLQAVSPLLPIIAGVLTQALTALLPPIMTIITSALPPLIALVQLLAPVIALLGDVIAMLGPPIMEIVGSLLPPLVGLLTTLFSAFSPLIPVISDLVTQLVDMALQAVMPLLPPLVDLVRALFPIIPPLIKIIDAALGLVQAFMPVIDIVTKVAGLLLGKLAEALVWLVEKAMPPIVKVLDGVAAAFVWLSEKIEDLIDWFKKLKPPDWLSSVGDWLGLSASAAAVTAPRLVTGFGGAAPVAGVPTAPSLFGTSSNPNPVTINMTVNAPYGGGEAIGRAIREELLKLDRRRGGIVIGGPRPQAVFG